ncbi:hypothetical protein BLNAU_25001 [Blattamonas nauphoetae]|uniref:Uncharacterized protein n=1 Tax=Blattamonas nauphoetae TaxID=2049346 RepID=A0ABQ9WLM3_9EUKA|nr:hypothetical protein BLNAU_25001 [Blattamonas nauphoetae]
MQGGALRIEFKDDILITSCRFEDCSSYQTTSGGGALRIYQQNREDYIPKLQLVDCVFEDCSTFKYGGGLDFYASNAVFSIVSTSFQRCGFFGNWGPTFGGGIRLITTSTAMKWCRFIECSSDNVGAAIFSQNRGEVKISDTLVQSCYSGATGAICIVTYDKPQLFSCSYVYFVGNTIGDDTSVFTERPFEMQRNTPKFTDVAVVSTSLDNLPTLKIEASFTTLVSDSAGMIVRGAYNSSTHLYDSERFVDPNLEKIGPLLTAKPTAKMNENTGKIELEMKGKTPLTKQEYEVTVKSSDGTATILKMLFSNGTGTLVSGSESNLKYNTSYTITSIVGVVPDSSSSQMANAIEVPVAAWAFNLAATPDYISFTPTKPSPTDPKDPTKPLPEDPKDPTEPEPEDPKKTLSPETKKLLSWLIPLVVCLVVGLALAIVIVFVVRRRQKKKAVPAPKEMEGQDGVSMEDKIEPPADAATNDVVSTEGTKDSQRPDSPTRPAEIPNSLP